MQAPYCSWRRSRCAGRHARRDTGRVGPESPTTAGATGAAATAEPGWNHAQDLAHLDRVRVLQVVPPRNVFPRLAVFKADTDQRIPRPDAVVARHPHSRPRAADLDHGAGVADGTAPAAVPLSSTGPCCEVPQPAISTITGQHHELTHKTTRYQHKQSFSGNPDFKGTKVHSLRARALETLRRLIDHQQGLLPPP